MRQPKPILTIKPGTLTTDAIAKIERGGYLVVECDPGALSSASVMPRIVELNDMIIAALNGLDATFARYGGAGAESFVKELLRRLKLNEAAALQAIEEARSQ